MNEQYEDIQGSEAEYQNVQNGCLWGVGSGDEEG